MKRTQTSASPDRAPKRQRPQHQYNAAASDIIPQFNQWSPQNAQPLTCDPQQLTNNFYTHNNIYSTLSSQPYPSQSFPPMYATPQFTANTRGSLSNVGLRPQLSFTGYSDGSVPSLVSQYNVYGGSPQSSAISMPQGQEGLGLAMPSSSNPYTARQSIAAQQLSRPQEHVRQICKRPSSASVPQAPKLLPQAPKPSSHVPKPSPEVPKPLPEVPKPLLQVQESSPSLPVLQQVAFPQAKEGITLSDSYDDQYLELQALANFNAAYNKNKESEKRKAEEAKQRLEEEGDGARQAIQDSTLNGYPSQAYHTNLSLEPAHDEWEQLYSAEAIEEAEDINQPKEAENTNQSNKAENLNQANETEQTVVIKSVDSIEEAPRSQPRVRAIRYGSPNFNWLKQNNYSRADGPWEVYAVAQSDFADIEWRVARSGSSLEEIKLGPTIQNCYIIRDDLFSGAKGDFLARFFRVLFSSTPGTDNDFIMWGK